MKNFLKEHNQYYISLWQTATNRIEWKTGGKKILKIYFNFSNCVYERKGKKSTWKMYFTVTMQKIAYS